MANEKELRVHGACECWPEDLLDQPQSYWAIARTLPRQEKKLCRDARELGLPGCMFYEQRIHRYKHKGIYRSLVPLISGYAFLAISPHDHDRIYDTKRIFSLISIGGDDAARFTHDMLQLKRVLLAYDGKPMLQPQIQPGDEVEIRCGCFSGCRGVVLRRKGQVSLVVNLHLLEQSVSVDLPASTAELADLPW